MNDLDISNCSLNRFAHSDCMIVGIPLQITPHSMRYVVSPDAFHPPLHLLQSLKKPGICAWEFGLMVHLKQFTSRHHTCSSPLLAASHSESLIRWRVGSDTHFYSPRRFHHDSFCTHGGVSRISRRWIRRTHDLRRVSRRLPSRRRRRIRPAARRTTRRRRTRKRTWAESKPCLGAQQRLCPACSVTIHSSRQPVSSSP